MISLKVFADFNQCKCKSFACLNNVNKLFFQICIIVIHIKIKYPKQMHANKPPGLHTNYFCILMPHTNYFPLAKGGGGV